MKTKKSCLTFIIAGLILCSVCAIYGAEWSQWRGENRDGKISGFVAPPTWPTELTQKWRVTVGKGDASPVFFADKLYLYTRQNDQETVLCLNATDGTQVWQTATNPAPNVSGPAGSHPGPRSTPTIAEGKVLTLGAGGVLTCLDATSGKIVWSKNEYTSVPRFFTSLSPIVINGMCVVHLGGADDGVILALDIKDGSEKWKIEGYSTTYSSPVLMTVDGEKMIVLQTEKALLGISIGKGKILWQLETPNERRFYGCADPIINGQIVYYTGQGTGTRAIKITKDGNSCSIEQLWHNDKEGTTFNTPLLKDNLLYGLSPTGRFYCLESKDGSVVWADTTAHKNFGAFLDAGNVLLANPSESGLIVIKPGTRTYSELAQYKLSDTPIYATPLVVGNNIYIKDEETLTLWVIK